MMDEEAMQMAAMQQALGGGGMGGAPMEGPADPFGGEAPPGYTTVYVPDSVLPAVMELVGQAEGSAESPEMAGMAAPADMGMGMDMGMDMSAMGEMPPF
jgi:hypothetical protein